MELLTLGVFCALLLGCIVPDVSILYALAAGILFACFLYLLPLWRLVQSAIAGRKTRA